jgi:hypothetical protein
MVRRFPKPVACSSSEKRFRSSCRTWKISLPPTPSEGLHDHLPPALGQEIDQLGDPMCDDRLRHQLGEVQGVELLVGRQDALGAVEHEGVAAEREDLGGLDVGVVDGRIGALEDDVEIVVEHAGAGPSSTWRPASRRSASTG